MTHTAALTQRQADVLDALATGASNKEIAAKLSCSMETVRTHLQNAYRHLGVSNRQQAAAKWLALPAAVSRLEVLNLRMQLATAVEVLAAHNPNGGPAHNVYINRQLRRALGVTP